MRGDINISDKPTKLKMEGPKQVTPGVSHARSSQSQAIVSAPHNHTTHLLHSPECKTNMFNYLCFLEKGKSYFGKNVILGLLLIVIATF